MLAQFTRTVAVGITAFLVLVMSGAPQAAADDPTTPPGAASSEPVPDVEGGPPADQPTESAAPSGQPTDSATTSAPAEEPTESPTTPATSAPAPQASPSPSATDTPRPQVRSLTPASAAALAPCAGVWFAVQPGLDQEPVLTCVDPSSGQNALELVSGIHTVDAPGGYISQIDGARVDTNWATNGNLFWSLCTATATESGDLTWAIAQTGAGEVVPVTGTAVGLLLGKWTDDPATQCPTVSSLPFGSSTPTTPTSPPREPASGSALDAAGWVKENLPAAGDPDGQWQAILAMASVEQCSFAPAVASQLALLKKEAADYVADNPGRAGRLAIVAAAVGEDPYDFGGVDLIAAILDGTQTDGQVNPGANPFSQSLAIIALTRAGEPVPAEMVSALLGMQNAAGAFGFGSGDSFWPDLDATGLAIQALTAVGGMSAEAAIDSAIGWILPQQEASGMWPNEWGSPANTTGLVGSSLELAGTDTGTALTWLQSQQLADGGFPNTLDGEESDLFATTEALFLLTGTTYLTVELDLSGACADADGDTPETEDDAERLPDTGANDATGMLGITAVVLVAAGGALVSLRRTRQH